MRQALIGFIVPWVALAAAAAANLTAEEFGIALPGQRSSAAELPLNRARAAIRAAGSEGIGESVTLSFGVAEPVDPDESLTNLRQRADLALYQAKHGGRDRVQAAAV